MLFIQHNLLAENANRQLNINTNKNAKITEKLSSGYKINRAADDAAGLAISEKMRRQIRGLHQGSENIKDGVGYVQTAEGALNEVHDMLQRINELAVKAASETNTDVDREYIDSEVQALKKEIDRIFDTTSFNEQKIWEVKKSREVIGQRKEDVVKFNYSSSYFDITDENCGVVAKGSYNMKANKDGVTVSWTGYNGKSYATDTIKWENIEQNNYSFEISDYFKAEDTDLISPTTGEKLFKHKISMSVNSAIPLDEMKDEVRDEIIAVINGPNNNGTSISQSLSIPISARFEDKDGNDTKKQWDTGTRVSFSGSLNHAAAYDSYINSPDGYDFDTAKDVFIESTVNNATNLQCPSADNEKWVFSFYMEGIGNVTAESSSISYSASDTTGTEGVWWDWVYPQHGTPYKGGNGYSISGGTLGTVKSALSPTSKNGLLNKSTYGLANTSGQITLYFNLKSGDRQIGSINTTIPVKCGKNGETPQNVLDRIDDVFNTNTILDIYTSDGNVQGTSAGQIHRYDTNWLGKVDVPVYGNKFVYGGVHNFWVQAGAEAGQHIPIEYEALNIIIIGLEDTNVLTTESASNAIDEVKQALKKVSEQRSLFGAYQNRLEHAYNNNENVVENTQSAESLIRDTDIADAMMEYSINNILMQAGTSMLTQANQSSQSILELLQ